jgi:hypothetical protein
VRTGISRGVSLTIERMMAKNPAGRVQTARDLCEMIDEQCLGERDLARELGLERPKAKESLWDMKVAIGGRVEKRRFSISDVRTRIRKGQIKRDTPTRRAGKRGEYQPAGSFHELAREFPQSYATPAAGAKDAKGATTTTTRTQMHDLLSRFDKEKRSHARKRKLKKLVPFLVEFAVLAICIWAAIRFWPQISEFVSGLLGKGGETP